MKSLFLRSMLALACAATLAACGGSDDNVILGGSVSGLSKTGLVLKNGSATLTVASGATSFVFADRIGANSSYDVDIQTQPTGAVCSLSGDAGKSSTSSVTTVKVVCVTNTYNLGGTISGLGAGETLTLRNSPENLTGQVNGAFTFATKVADGSTYGVSVLDTSVPAGKSCTIANAAGTMGSADLSTIAVTCTTP